MFFEEQEEDEKEAEEDEEEEKEEEEGRKEEEDKGFPDVYLRAVESDTTKATSPQEGEEETTTQGNSFKDPFWEESGPAIAEPSTS